MAFSAVPQVWVTTADVDDVLEGGVPGDRVVFVDGLVERYAGEVVSRLSRPPSVVVTEERCRVLNSGVIDTRHRPVVSLESASWIVTGTAETAVEMSSGLLKLTYAPRLTLAGDLLVSYTAGFSDQVLAALRGAVVDRIKRKLTKVEDDAEGVDALSEEGYSPTYTPDGWTESEIALFDSVRRRAGA